MGFAGSWDESLRLWHRVGHPNNTPKGSTALDDLTQDSNTKVSSLNAALSISKAAAHIEWPFK